MATATIVNTLQPSRESALKQEVIVHEQALEDQFQKWRPSFHVMPIKGWMNDPCAPGYDKERELYTLSFQWNPKAAVWGNMSWGSALSKDLVNWVISDTPSMVPDAQDPAGVFTGSMIPDSTNAFYTSAQRLPISYHLPYQRGSEKLHQASSSDSGRTWRKTGAVPLLPPAGLDVTGWRDPFVGPWASMDRVRGEQPESKWYGMLSGGIRNKTPTIFLYSVQPDNPGNWTYLSSLVDFGLRFEPSRWTGNYGVHWEVASIVTLSDQHQSSRDFVLLGSQGLVQDDVMDDVPLSTNNRSMWMTGSVQPDATMRWQHGGALDHGCCYAANGFRDPVTKQFVLFGWIFEEDLPQALADEQEWSGCLSIPRVLSLRLYQNVTALRTDIEEITCFEKTASVMHTGFDVSVLTMMPDSRLHKLRRERLPMKFTKPQGQLECRLKFNVEEINVGFDLQHSTMEKTTVTFNPQTETITVDRSMSSLRLDIVKTSKTAPHTLFRYPNGEIEPLEFTVYYDTSVVEIFANDRTALTTRVYPESGACIAVKSFSEHTHVSQCEIWSLDKSTTWYEHEVSTTIL
jgi:beta-fructofuranosidase